MAFSEEDAKDLVRKRKGGSIVGVHGPYSLAGTRIWEVWTKKDGEYEVRFAIDNGGNELEYREGVAALAETFDAKMSTKVLIVRVAAVGFLSTLAALIYVTLNNGLTGEGALLFGGALASASAMFYGKWRLAS